MIPEIIYKDKKLCDAAQALRDVAGDTERYMDSLYSEGNSKNVAIEDMNRLLGFAEKEYKKLGNFIRVARARGYYGR